MKKVHLILASLLVFSLVGFAQVNLTVEAPLNNGSTTQVRAPNGLSTSAYMRACALVLQSELTNLPANTVLTSFGFTLSTGTSGTPVAGNFTVYLQNTADLTYQKGTNYTTAITGMTSVFANVMTIPLSAGTTSIMLTLSTPFTYTGGGLYVAYDWVSTGPFSATPATYLAESAALNPGCASAVSAASSPTLLTTTNFRPSFLFGAANSYTNDIKVTSIDALGKVSLIYGTPQIIRCVVYNGSNIAKSNFSVTLNATGTNPFSNTQAIANLPAGGSTVVAFSAYNPTSVGLTTLTAAVDPDQNNNNNAASFPQLVTCNFHAKNPPTGLYSLNSVGFGAATGIIGNLMLIPSTTTLAGINFAIGNNAASVGGQLFGVLMNPAGTILAVTNTLTITTPMLGTFRELNFISPQTVFGSTSYIIGMAQMAVGTSTYFPFGAQASPYVLPTTYVTTALAGGPTTPLTQNFGFFGIEAIFTHTANATIVPTPTTLCVGNSLTLTANGPVTSYTWSTGSNASSIAVTPASAIVYSLTTSNAIGCISRASVSVNALPTLTMYANSNTVCAGGTATLYVASPNASFNWNTDSTTFSTIESPTTTTTYSVTVTNQLGCQNTGVITVSVVLPAFSVSSNTYVCQGSSITLTASSTNQLNYQWSTGWGTSILVVSPTTNTVYSVTAGDQNGCTATKSISVAVNPLPNVLATAPTTMICRNEPLTLTANGANTYTWNTAATGSNVVITPTLTGNFTYSVTGTDGYNCSNTASILIRVNACIGLLETTLNENTLSVFPNPCQTKFTVSTTNYSENSDIQLFNSNGQLILKKELDGLSCNIPVENLAPGMYLLQLSKNGVILAAKRILKE